MAHETKSETKSKRKAKKAAASTPAPEHAAEAFALLRDEILAVPEAELLRINVDIPRAAGRGTLAAERIAVLMPLLRELPRYDAARVERLGLYALALHHAHDLATEAGTARTVLRALRAEAVPLREGMLRSAELLAHFGLVSAKRVAAIRSGHGLADMADDVIALGRLYLEEWPRVVGKTPITLEMVERAPVLGVAIHKALAQREVERSPLVPPDDPRYVQAQAFTLFARVYDEARRGVSFLRWRERDASRLVPTLYPQRPRRSESEEVGEVDEVDEIDEVEEVEEVDQDGEVGEDHATDATDATDAVPEPVAASDASAVTTAEA